MSFRYAPLERLIDPFRPADGPPPRKLLAFMRWCLSGALPMLGFAAVISSLAGVIEVMTALVLGAVIDSAVEAGPEAFFGQHGLLIAGFLAFFLLLRPVFFGLSAAINSVVIMPNILPLVLSRLNRWTMGQPVRFFDDDFAGRIAQKQMQTARAVTDVTSEIINVVFFALASLVGAALVLSTIDWRVALGLVVWLALYLGIIIYLMPKIRQLSGKRAAARAMVTGQVVDAVTNIKTVKLFAHRDFEDRAALAAMADFRETALHFGWLAALFRFALMGLAGLLPVLLIGGALMLWSQGMASVGAIAAAGAVAIRIAQMTGWVSFTLMAVYSNIGEVEDGMQTLTPPYSVEDAPGSKPLEMGPAEIGFDQVGFAYGRDSGGVQGLSLAVAPGEKLGIVGASGAGKSTLVALLLRLYDPESGRITVSGQDIRHVTQESLRRQIAMVTQETAMFNRSALDNIRYGRADATDAQVIEAAKRAEAHDFITELEDHEGRQGYEAHLGERGVKLSGGQRQRIALARAILKDAPILVLDEATSALDSEVEAAIQTALTRVMDGKTVLAIAHRLSTIASMDRIIVLEQGQIVEEGSHDSLLAQNGTYARYWNRQSGGFIGQEAAE
ncbi:MAG: ABC transporter ATP-binding protein/permease [Mangrovicoccus sp.]|nr:ABC transporter ATP-binding protein/permease [Mangrovicoccus sp.]